MTETFKHLEFGDGTYRFQLRMGEILEIEEKVGRPIGAIYRATLAGRYEQDGVQFGYSMEAEYSAAEIIEVCRQGLIGGAAGEVDGRPITVTDVTATRLVRKYLYPENGNPLSKAWDLAALILHAAVVGYAPAQEAQKKSILGCRKKRASTEARSSPTA